MTLQRPTRLVRKAVSWLALPGLLLGTLAADGPAAEEKAPYKFEEVKGLDTKVELLAVRALDAKSCILVGDEGFIARSADAGKTWTAVKSKTTATLRDVRFATPLLGVAVGDGGGYAVPDPKDRKDLLRVSTHVMNGGYCWSTVLRTQDGGKTWKRIEPPTNFAITRVVWLDRRRAVAVTGDFQRKGEPIDGSILTSEDTGKTWKFLYSLGSPCRSIAVAADQQSWVVGAAGKKPGKITHNGRELKSIKDLTPLEMQTLPADFKRTLSVPDTWNATSVYLGDPRVPLNGEQVIADSLTVDPMGVGGAPSTLWDVRIVGTRAWVVGDVGLLAYADRRGRKWQAWKAVEFKDPEPAGFRALAFRDAKTGLVVGEQGVCYSTKDGGKTWKKVDTNTVSALNGVQFMGTAAIVVGEDGTAFRLVPQ